METKSPVSICNYSLDIIREANIVSLDGTDFVSKICKRHYDRVRVSLLTSNIWNFASKTVTLSTVNGYEGEDCYISKYNLPKECVRLIKIGGIDIPESGHDGLTYKSTDDSILSKRNDSTLKVTYIKDVTEVHRMPIWYTNLLSALIAEEICLPISNDSSRYQIAVTKARQFRLNAYKSNGISKPHQNLNDGHIMWGRQY